MGEITKVDREIDLIVFDYPKKGFDRYAVSLIDHLRSLNDNFHAVAVYVYEDENKTVSEIFEDSVCVSKCYYNIGLLIDKYHPKAVLTFAFREFDYLMTIEAHKRGINVFNFQHAAYKDYSYRRNEISIGFYARKIRRLFDQDIRVSAKGIWHLSNHNPFIFLQNLRHILPGHTPSEFVQRIYPTESQADDCFVFGKSYIDFFKSLYHQKSSEFHVIGYPELELPVRGRDEIHELQGELEGLPAICFCDSIDLKEDIMCDYFKQLINCLEKMALLIKIHPLCEKDKYLKYVPEELRNHVIIYDYPEFPSVDGYIGFESTVLIRALYITKKLLVFDYDGVVSTYKDYTGYYAADKNEISNLLNAMLEDKEPRKAEKRIEDFVHFNKKNGALKETASIIAEKMHANEV